MSVVAWGGQPAALARRSLDRRGVALAALATGLVVPLVVALVVLRDPRWLALDDLAQVEMQVRDVVRGHPPLLGLGGRIESGGHVGSHPGPIAFYVLSPVYELLGADGWALQAAAVTLAGLAAVLAVWIAERRGGVPFALAATAVLVLLLRGYGFEVLASAWNPHLPVVWWVVFLLAAWSVLCGDVRLLPVAVAAGALCAQTHLPYVAPVAAVGALVTGTLAFRLGRGRGGEAERRRLLLWGAAATGLLVVLFVPPLVEQLSHSPGNVTVIVESFRHPEEARVSGGKALDVWLERLDVAALARTDTNPVFETFDPRLRLGRRIPGLVLLAVWAGAVALAWRRRAAALLRLHGVLAVAEATMLVAISRILGPPWPYLAHAGWGTGALVLLATLWTYLSIPAAGDAPARSAAPAGEAVEGAAAGAAAAVAAAPGPGAAAAAPGPVVAADGAPGDVPVPAAGGDPVDPGDPRGGPGGVPDRVAGPRWPRPVMGALALATLVVGAAFLVDAAHTERADAALATAIDDLARATSTRLADDPAGCGGDCTYLVKFTDRVHIVSPVFGLQLALEKRGHDVRVDDRHLVAVRSHRVVDGEPVDAELHLAVGQDVIAGWQDRQDAEQITVVDPPEEEPLAVFLVGVPAAAG